MEFFKVVEKRRSVRKFTDKEVPEEIMRKCLKAATLAPNSSLIANVSASSIKYFFI